MKVLEFRCDSPGCDAKLGAVCGSGAETQLYDLATHKSWFVQGSICYCAVHRPKLPGPTAAD